MRSVALFALIALLGCTEPDTERNGQATAVPAVAGETGRTGPGGAAEAPAPQEPDQSPPQSPADEPRECGADKYRYLIGKHRREIPKQPDGASWRITCTACAITQDYSPGRLNIFYDEESGIVKDVRCG